MTPQQHDRLLMLLRNDNWPMADQIHVMNLVRQEFPATLRDEFAMSALPEFISHTRDRKLITDPLESAVSAYAAADAMLQARKS